jgi:hypothetical protein
VCTGVSREVRRRLGWRHHGAMRDGRGTQSSPVGNAAGGPAGSTSERGAGLGTRPEGVCSGTRGDAIMASGAWTTGRGGRRGRGGGTTGATWPTCRRARTSARRLKSLLNCPVLKFRNL